MKWIELLSQALNKSGLSNRALPINDDLITEAQTALVRVLGRLDGEGLGVSGIDETVTFDTVGGQALYYLGTGDNTAVNSNRPQKIIRATFEITTNVTQVCQKISFKSYKGIMIKNNQGPPWNYAINYTYPQLEVYFYFMPDKAYSVSMYTKMPLIVTAGNPDTDLTAQIIAQPGLPEALVDILALELAEANRMQTPQMYNNERIAKQIIASWMKGQTEDTESDFPSGIMAFDILLAGMNP